MSEPRLQLVERAEETAKAIIAFKNELDKQLSVSNLDLKEELIKIYTTEISRLSTIELTPTPIMTPVIDPLFEYCPTQNCTLEINHVGCCIE